LARSASLPEGGVGTVVDHEVAIPLNGCTIGCNTFASTAAGPIDLAVVITIQHKIAIPLHSKERPVAGGDDDSEGVRGERNLAGVAEDSVAKGVGGFGWCVGENLVLSAIWESIGGIVYWCALLVCWVEHVISGVVCPIHRVQ